VIRKNTRAAGQLKKNVTGHVLARTKRPKKKLADANRKSETKEHYLWFHSDLKRAPNKDAVQWNKSYGEGGGGGAPGGNVKFACGWNRWKANGSDDAPARQPMIKRRSLRLFVDWWTCFNVVCLMLCVVVVCGVRGCWGTWVTFSAPISEEVAEEIVVSAYESGINVFDLSDGYCGPRAELSLGRILRQRRWRRASFVVITKIYWSYRSVLIIGSDTDAIDLMRNGPSAAAERAVTVRMDDGIDRWMASVAGSDCRFESWNQLQPAKHVTRNWTNTWIDCRSEERGLSKKHIIESVRSSLERLQLDYIDVILIHRADPMCPMEGMATGPHFPIDWAARLSCDDGPLHQYAGDELRAGLGIFPFVSSSFFSHPHTNWTGK
jgi:hypothetical protein